MSLVSRQRPRDAFNRQAKPGTGSVVNEDGRVSLASRGLTTLPPGVLDPSMGMEQWWLAPEVRTIDVCFNSITELPSNISNLAESLTVLKLAGNQIRALPASIAALVHLKALDASKNALSTLPDLSSLCVCLVDLQLGSNCLSDLHPSVGSLTKLERLGVAGNKLRALPDTIQKLSALADLDLSDNRLQSLPYGLSSCTRLRKLEICRNEISGSLDLSGLKCLEYVDLRQNALVAVLFSAPGLVETFLGLNRSLRSIPPTLPASPILAALDVSECGITDIPDWLRQASALNTLDVRNNDLQVLPAWLGFLPTLSHLAVDGNPLRSMKRSLVSGGSDGEGVAALKAYLRTRATEEEAMMYSRDMQGQGRGVKPAPAVSQPSQGSCQSQSGSNTTAAALAADRVESTHRGWVVCLRACMDDPHGRLVASPSSFPYPLSVSVGALVQASSGMPGCLLRVSQLVLDGHSLGGPGSGPRVDPLPAPHALCSVLPRLESLSLAHSELHSVPSACSAGGWLVGIWTGAQEQGGPPAAPLPWMSFCPLRAISLAHNHLTSHALSGVAFPPTLTSLDLSYNSLQEIPAAALANLVCLKSLNLSHNKLALPPQAGTAGASGTDVEAFLRVRRMSTDVPVRVDDCLWMPALSSLDLSHNGLFYLPASVMALPCLESLDVSANELAVIPPHLGMLGLGVLTGEVGGRLTSLGVEGNPQRGLRQAVTARGACAVLEALRARIPPGTEMAYLDAYRDRVHCGVHASGVPAWARLQEVPYRQGQLHSVQAAVKIPVPYTASVPLGTLSVMPTNVGVGMGGSGHLPPQVRPSGPTAGRNKEAQSGQQTDFGSGQRYAAPAHSGCTIEESVDMHDLVSVRVAVASIQMSLEGTGRDASGRPMQPLSGPAALQARRKMHQLMAAESRLAKS